MPEPEPQPEPQSQLEPEQQLQPQPQFSFSSQPQTAPAEHEQELAELGHLLGFEDDGPWVDQLAWLESRLAAQPGLVVSLQRQARRVLGLCKARRVVEHRGTAQQRT